MAYADNLDLISNLPVRVRKIYNGEVFVLDHFFKTGLEIQYKAQTLAYLRKFLGF